jgi:glyceraldehyde 3-phosphate dehydrogenase
MAAKKTIRIGINGFGRIGKVVFRLLQDIPHMEVVVINDLTDIRTLAHLLTYDSTHGKFKHDVQVTENHMVVNGKKTLITSFHQPEEIPWRNLAVDYVLESSGRFTTKTLLQKHLDAGAKKVLLSCPSQDPLDKTIVIGVNDHELRPEHRIISNASCTTNCIAPILKIFDQHTGLEGAFLNTIHPFTNNQAIIDAPHADLRRARTAGVNIIPTSSTAIAAVISVMPEMKGRFDGHSVRVPVHNGAIIELSAQLKTAVTRSGVNRLMKAQSEGAFRGILAYTEDPIVSSDIIGDPHSAIFDALSTRVLGKTFVQVIAWYDNETGYSCRIVELLTKMGKMDGII